MVNRVEDAKGSDAGFRGIIATSWDKDVHRSERQPDFRGKLAMQALTEVREGGPVRVCQILSKLEVAWISGGLSVDDAWMGRGDEVFWRGIGMRAGCRQ